MNIQFTKEEAQAAIQLFDMAVRANGLGVSEAATFLAKKLQDAFIEEVTPEEVNEPSGE